MADYTSIYTGEEIDERLGLAETSAQRSELDAKQDKIDDLAEIREGAEKGASALQTTDISEWAKQPDKPTYTADEVGAYTKAQVDDKLSLRATKEELVTLAQIVSEKADSSVVEDIAEEVDNKADKSELSALDEKVETTRLATDLSNLDANGREVIEGIAKERVFWATYGVTTYDEIKQAYEDGKDCVLVANGVIYKLSALAVNRAVFNSLAETISRTYTCSSTNIWSRGASYTLEQTQYRQNVLTKSEVNYPSSKGVMDYVEEQTRDFAKVTPTLTSGTKIADVESGGSVVPLYAPNGSGGSNWHSVLLTEADYNADVKGFLIDVGEGNEIAEVKIAGQIYTEEPNTSAQNVLVGFGYRLGNLTSPYQCFAFFSMPADRNFLNLYGTGESFEIGLRGTMKVYTQGGLLRIASHIRPSGEYYFDSNAQTDASKSTYVYDGYNNPRYFGIKNLWNSVSWARIRIEYRLR